MSMTIDPVEGYKYGKLDKKQQEFRLLTLEPGEEEDGIVCSIAHASINDTALSYEALSYCWGDRADMRQIMVSGSRMQVTGSLFVALQHLRLPSAQRVLWVDALCINQNDLAERAQQVRLMGQIYSTCNNVLIWLGEASKTSGSALSSLRSLSYDSSYDNFDERRRQNTIGSLLSRPWFDRVWVIQEMAVAKKCTFICGHDTLDVDGLDETMESAQYQHRRLTGQDEMPGYYHKLLSLLETRSIVQRIARCGHGLGIPFGNILNRHSGAQATDPRDNILAFIGVSNLEELDGLVVSYHLTTQQVYANLVKWWIAKYFQLDIITTYLDKQERCLNLPSWIPDWSGKSTTDVLNTAPPNPIERTGAFAAWTGRSLSDEKDRYMIYSVSVGHPRWYFGMKDGETDRLSVIQGPYYSKFLTLDGCLVDNIQALPGCTTKMRDMIAELGNTTPAKSFHFEGFLGFTEEIVRSFGFGNLRNDSSPKWAELLSIMKPADLNGSPYKTGESRISVFITTILSGNCHLGVPETEEEKEERKELEASFRQKDVANAGAYSWFPHDMRMSLNMDRRLVNSLKLRRFAITATGLYALVPMNTQPGDVIAVLVGGMVPFVLRKKIHDGGSTIYPNDLYLDDSTKAVHDGFGAGYAGTSRRPDSPLIKRLRRPPNERIELEAMVPDKVVCGTEDSYDPSWEVVGTAYVHGIMNGEIKTKYENGEADLQTFLLV
ncbi:Heterokaryon incompatibility 6-like protein [Cladobotryum mycophilum]|uniref:Heterokaryon incompatibility 6-like protein n=1 Tax=Cladobotryum mycophilum TaxID=491253 RepID=A0ABR0SH89_9HYPO